MAKVKLADIAKEANVSIATVSYVLNNVPNQKINENTRRKIIQLAQLFGYTKNSFASALANGISKHIGIYIGEYSFSLLNAELLKIITLLTEKLQNSGYTTKMLSRSTYTMSIDSVDAIIAISLSDDDFKMICSNSIIPVIAVDTKSKEPWIFEISNSVSQVKSIFNLEEYVLICYALNSKEIMDQISFNNKNCLFVSDFSQLKSIDSLDKKKIVAGDELFEYLNSMGIDALRYPLNINNKVNKIIECMKLAINHTDVDVHQFEM